MHGNSSTKFVTNANLSPLWMGLKASKTRALYQRRGPFRCICMWNFPGKTRFFLFSFGPAFPEELRQNSETQLFENCQWIPFLLHVYRALKFPPALHHLYFVHRKIWKPAQFRESIQRTTYKTFFLHLQLSNSKPHSLQDTAHAWNDFELCGCGCTQQNERMGCLPLQTSSSRINWGARE